MIYQRPLGRRQAKRSRKGWHTHSVIQKILFLNNNKEQVGSDINMYLGTLSSHTMLYSEQKTNLRSGEGAILQVPQGVMIG